MIELFKKGTQSVELVKKSINELQEKLISAKLFKLWGAAPNQGHRQGPRYPNNAQEGQEDWHPLSKA